MDEPNRLPGRVRRQPPPFRPVEVAKVERLTPRMARVTFAGPALEGFSIDEPAASVRLLLPPRGSRELVMPEWTGNEFLLPTGDRPTIRTFTPRRLDAGRPALDLEIVVHGGGAASEWAAVAGPGDRAAISGPGRGYTVEPAPWFLVGGDETALPAIGQLLEWLPATAAVDVHIEIAAAEARLQLPAHPRAAVTWHELPEAAPPGAALVEAVTAADIAPDAQVWVAGEAAAVQRIRRHLFQERGLSRQQASVRGYWKHGRAGGSDD